MLAPCRWIVTAVVTTSLIGCSIPPFDTTPLNPDPAPSGPRPAASVEVFVSGPPSRPRVDVREIYANGNDDPAVEIAALRAEAGRQGCDAIFVPNVAETHGGRQKATCIRYTKP